jgi:LuxR family maltose regulon positive regulatory protein
MERRVGRTDPPTFVFEPLRTRALSQIDLHPGRSPKLLCMVAPVGYGKTVQMATRWADLRRTGRQCVWFALDDRDTTLTSLIEALQALLNGHEALLHPTQALFRGQAPDDSRIDALTALIAAYPLPVTLFIDNLNCCTDPALGRLLDPLVFATPASVHLVLSSTCELPLDSSRAQLQGLIRTLGVAELSLNAGEVGKLLGAELSRRIGARGIEAITQETEGWPAAVRMAQIILSQSDQPQDALKLFSGADEVLAHLLNRQVLSGLPPAVRDFLLCIAPLRTFCLDLCAQVTGSHDGGEQGGEHASAHLAYLLNHKLFVIPLDRNRHWYRLHGLFRDFLLHEAEHALDATRRQAVLIQAAHWCERHGYWREAVDYALASGALAVACQILERIAPLFVRDRGQVQPYILWLDALHAQGQQAGPETEYWLAWALAFCRRYDEARQRILLLADRVAVDPGLAGADERADLPRRIAMLKASIDSLSDHREASHRGASAWLNAAREGIDDPFNIAAAYCIESCYFSNGHHFVEARQAVQSAREAAFQANSMHVEGWVSAYAALIAVHEGDHASAYPVLVDALAKARLALGDDAGICGTMALVAAKSAAEMGLDEEAWRLFTAGARTARTHGFLDAAACGLDAALLLWRGTPDDRVSLAVLRDIAGAYPPRLSLMLSCFLTQRLITLGRLDDASAEADRAGLDLSPRALRGSTSPVPGCAHLDALIEATQIEWLVASGRYKQAETLMAEALRQAQATHCVATQVQLALAAADVAVRTAQPAQAVRHLTRAVSLSAPRNIVRPFQDRAAMLAAVVADTKAGAWGFATADERRFFADRCRSLAFNEQALNERLAAAQDAPQAATTTTLTARELELLGYVDAGLSNQQIADRSGVSVTTVKWHFQNVYTKLEVNSRSAALARARVLNLLPR